jgi:hypothetical protein
VSVLLQTDFEIGTEYLGHMDRCPFRPSANSICHTVGAQHKLNGSCQCVRAGFDHLDHVTGCGTKWTSGATSAQIDALRVIASNPGITAMRFAKVRESRGLTFRQLRSLGLIDTPKDKEYNAARAHLTAAGAAAVVELLDTGRRAAP